MHTTLIYALFIALFTAGLVSASAQSIVAPEPNGVVINVPAIATFYGENRTLELPKETSMYDIGSSPCPAAVPIAVGVEYCISRFGIQNDFCEYKEADPLDSTLVNMFRSTQGGLGSGADTGVWTLGATRLVVGGLSPLDKIYVHFRAVCVGSSFTLTCEKCE